MVSQWSDIPRHEGLPWGMARLAMTCMSSTWAHNHTSKWIIPTHITAKPRFLTVKWFVFDESAQRKLILRIGPTNFKNINYHEWQLNKEICEVLAISRENCLQLHPTKRSLLEYCWWSHIILFCQPFNRSSSATFLYFVPWNGYGG